MLSGASRICCVGLVVMAPALKKADNAKSYHFPLVEILDIKYSSHFSNTEKWGSDCGDRLSSLSQSYNPRCDTFPWNSLRYKVWLSTARLSHGYKSYLKKYLDAKFNVNRRKKRDCSARDGVDKPPIQSYRTMNRDISPVQDSMGLLNTNTSLDCDFKAHCIIGHQSAFTTVEQELLVMSPKELEDPGEYSIFEVTSDSVEHTLTPPASRPGSVPVVTASLTKVLPSTSVAPSKQIDLYSSSAKAKNLMMRLRKLQTQQAECHVVPQLKNFVSHQQRNLGIFCQRPLHSRRMKDSVKTELFHSEDVKNLSTAALVKLVRRLESSHISTKLPHSQKGVWVDADGNMAKLSSSDCIETKRVAGTLLTNLHHLEMCMDSDVTESSSGGESCDEYDMHVSKKSHTVNIQRRAEWKWAVDRASIASRWTWLQTQVSDLECSIRQHNDIHCKIQLSKQPVIFDCPIHADLTGSYSSVDCLSSLGTHSGDSSSTESALYLSGSSKELRNLPVTNKHLTKPVNGLLDAGTNGYHPVRGVLNNNSNSGLCVDLNINQISSASHAVCCSSRTRPLKSFKKRKLYHTTGLHLLNKKAAQLSTVKCNCNCQCKMLPCALCSGRYNIIQTVDQDMPVIERISLLDPSFHPFLSFDHEILYDLVVQKLLKYTEISKSLSQRSLHLKKKRHMSTPTKGLNNPSRKSTCKLARNAAQTLLCSAKRRKNFGGKKPRAKTKLVGNGKRKYVRKKQREFDLTMVKKRSYRRRTLSVASSGSSKPDSPVPSPNYWNTDGFGGTSHSFTPSNRSSILHDVLRRRRGENTFDINNIVIPYSVASLTRVEKIAYKEIVTPKWRLIENVLPSDTKDNLVLDSNEDTADAVYSERHGVCEIEEKKRFSVVYTHAHPHGRVRSRSRGDLHADSSDGNTPDALSPHHLDILGQDSNSSLNITDYLPSHASPISMFLEDSMSSIVMAYPNAERRRTASFTRKDWSDESRIDVEEVEEVAPYEPYVFPLGDEVYEEMLENSPHLIRVSTPPPPPSPSLPVDDLLHSCSNSPISPTSSSSSSIVDDDPCDPEWTVVSERGSHQSLVLKFAKR